MNKTAVLEVIGEACLTRSADIDAALSANDRIKYYLSLLQAGAAHADRPEQPADSLRLDRLACGIGESGLDNLVAGSRRENGRYYLPGCAEALEHLAQDLRIMAAPALDDANEPAQRMKFAEKMERVAPLIPSPQQDWIEGAAIGELTRAGTEDAPSLHGLVMALHKALNAMQAELAEERVDGAAVHHIQDADRPLIAAFMAGLNRTAPLKFNHPGLGTTAARDGNRLIVQNDLGTTDAHVLVIHIEGLAVQLIHTDVHPERIQFLRDMLKSYAVNWGQEQSKQTGSLGSGEPFQLVTARFESKEGAELLAYLTFLGSRLVFLIDWNRARKELRDFLRGKDRVALLNWAAEAEVGHRAFLELGGAQLVNRAIEDTAGSAIHFGDRLCDVLGDAAAVNFLRFVLQAATDGLRGHQSPGLIRDRIRAELQAYFSSEGKRLLELAGEQAAMIFEIATLARDGIRRIASGEPDGHYQLSAKRAREFEHNADQLVLAGREAVRHRPEYATLFHLLETADNAADGLEEVVFLIELLVGSQPGGAALEELAGLADLLVEGAQEWIKALSHAAQIDNPGELTAREDARDFLTAIDAVFELEHRADDAERALTYSAVQGARDFRQLYIYSKMAHSLEEASDALKWAGLIARDYLLGDVLNA